MFKCTPLSVAYAASSQFHASNCTTEEVPLMVAPSGTMLAWVMPFDLSVLITFESVLYATRERTEELNSPISTASAVARTVFTSTKPRLELERMRPGYTCLPLASTVVAPAEAVMLLPMAAIFPSRISTEVLLSTCPFPTCTVPFEMKMALVCALAGYTVSCACVVITASSARTFKNIFFI